MAHYRARQSLCMEIDGAPVTVEKGAVLDERHPVIRHHLKVDSVNFEQLEDDAPARKPAVRAKAESEATE